jgi:hypothetical protein
VSTGTRGWSRTCPNERLTWSKVSSGAARGGWVGLGLEQRMVLGSDGGSD